MSRTSFAEQCNRLSGMAPPEYPTRWRMMIARGALGRVDANLGPL
jgi:AraC-like DNA-binding protein